MSELPHITFGMIVLNGEPFISYNLRAIYPYAHQIIVVEGAAPGALSIASKDGHSTDGTLEKLLRFKELEDSENKLLVVTAEDEGHPDGFWPGEKDEQSKAYAGRANGDYLWQVDVDEFYRSKDMETILHLLKADSDISAVSFKMLMFWGGFDYLVDGYFLRQGIEIFHRLFKWGPGYKYVSHRPPTVVDTGGKNLRSVRWLDGNTMAKKGIYLYHYSSVFPKQVREKSSYYQAADWAKRDKAEQWAQEVFMELKQPYRVHNVYTQLSWLERANVEHPQQIVELQKDIDAGEIDIELRQTSDIEDLLNSASYRTGRAIFKFCEPLVRNYWRPLRKRMGKIGRLMIGDNEWQKASTRINRFFGPR